MTAKEFVSKHYGSLSAGVFAVGLLAVLGVYGGGFTAMGPPADPALAVQQAGAAAPAAVAPPSEALPEEGASEGAAKADEAAEEDQDPLEQAMADERAKADERREQVREQINKEREAAGLPLLPPIAPGEVSQQ